MDKENKKYEIGFLAKNESFKEEIIKLLVGFGAEITDSGNASRINLAYPIKKETSAVFGYVYFSGQPDIVKKIGDNLRLNSEVLRHIIIISPAIRQSARLAAKKTRYSVPFEKPTEKPEIKRVKTRTVLSNEALEKKLEEILK
jgi:ribosomal protein S6